MILVADGLRALKLSTVTSPRAPAVRSCYDTARLVFALHDHARTAWRLSSLDEVYSIPYL